MRHWYMLTIVGSDQPGIVAKITQSLYQADCQLGEASMIRLGGNFTIMLMVASSHDDIYLTKVLSPICQSHLLTAHWDKIEGKLHDHPTPDALITVSGADRPGIIAQVTEALFSAGMDILDLTSDVAGTEESPLYIMQIEGVSKDGIETLEAKVKPLLPEHIDVKIKAIDFLLG